MYLIGCHVRNIRNSTEEWTAWSWEFNTWLSEVLTDVWLVPRTNHTFVVTMIFKQNKGNLESYFQWQIMLIPYFWQCLTLQVCLLPTNKPFGDNSDRSFFFIRTHSRRMTFCPSIGTDHNPLDVSTWCDVLASFPLLCQARVPWFDTPRKWNILSARDLHLNCQPQLDVYDASSCFRSYNQDSNSPTLPHPTQPQPHFDWLLLAPFSASSHHLYLTSQG